MVLIVKRLVPVYPPGKAPKKQYENLRKAVHVTTFPQPYPTIPKILVEQYGLKPDEKIVVFWMRGVRGRKGGTFRTPFKKVYAGSVRHFLEELKNSQKNSSDAPRFKKCRKVFPRTPPLPAAGVGERKNAE